MDQISIKLQKPLDQIIKESKQKGNKTKTPGLLTRSKLITKRNRIPRVRVMNKHAQQNQNFRNTPTRRFAQGNNSQQQQNPQFNANFQKRQAVQQRNQYQENQQNNQNLQNIRRKPRKFTRPQVVRTTNPINRPYTISTQSRRAQSSQWQNQNQYRNRSNPQRNNYQNQLRSQNNRRGNANGIVRNQRERR